MDRLDELRTLAAIVDEGSLVGAARRLGRSPPSITRALAELEARVGAMLVERSTRRCRPTPPGLRLAEQARQLLSGYDQALGDAVDELATPEGLIRITAPITFGGRHVAPLVNTFLDLFPHISVDLHLSDRLLALREEEFDLAVRIGRVGDELLIARTVGELRQIVAASPLYLATRGTPTDPADLAQHEVVQHSTFGGRETWLFRGASGNPTAVTVKGRLALNQPEPAIDAAREGRGIVRALSYQVAAELRAGELVRLLRDFEPDPLPVRVIWPESRRAWRRVRLLADHLVRGLGGLSAIDRP